MREKTVFPLTSVCLSKHIWTIQCGCSALCSRTSHFLQKKKFVNEKNYREFCLSENQSRFTAFCSHHHLFHVCQLNEEIELRTIMLLVMKLTEMWRHMEINQKKQKFRMFWLTGVDLYIYKQKCKQKFSSCQADRLSAALVDRLNMRINMSSGYDQCNAEHKSSSPKK